MAYLPAEEKVLRAARQYGRVMRFNAYIEQGHIVYGAGVEYQDLFRRNLLTAAVDLILDMACTDKNDNIKE